MSGLFTLLAAVRVAKHGFGATRNLATYGKTKVWSYTTVFPSARVSMSRDYEAICRCRNREIVHQALLLVGWPKLMARECADAGAGRGTMHEQIAEARVWRRNRKQERAAKRIDGGESHAA